MQRLDSCCSVYARCWRLLWLNEVEWILLLLLVSMVDNKQWIHVCLEPTYHVVLVLFDATTCHLSSPNWSQSGAPVLRRINRICNRARGHNAKPCENRFQLPSLTFIVSWHVKISNLLGAVYFLVLNCARDFNQIPKGNLHNNETI